MNTHRCLQQFHRDTDRRLRQLRLVTFRVSRRQREMYIGHARLSVCLCVCVSVRRRMPTLLYGPRCNLGNGRGAP